MAFDPDYFNVRDYGGAGDGSTDDTAAITAAIAAAVAVGGGTVYFPRGTFITGTLPLYSSVNFEGSGEEASIVKLKAGTNSDLFQGTIQGYTNGVNGYTGASALTNYAAAPETGNNTGVTGFAIRLLTLDGNTANQTGPGSAIHVYGYGYRLENLYIREFQGDGLSFDWNPATPSFSLAPNQLEHLLSNVKVHDIGYGIANGTAVGIRHGGSTDCQWVNVVVYKTQSHAVHIGPNAGALQAMNCHFWGVANNNRAAAILCEGNGCMFNNCEAEGSDACQVVLVCAATQWNGGKVFGGGAPGTAYYGFQLGQAAGDLPWVGSCNQTTPGSLANPATAGAGTVYACSASVISTYIENTYAGAFNPRTENSNLITALCNQAGETPMLVTPTGVALSFTDRANVSSKGIATDHTFSTVGGFQCVGDSNSAFIVFDPSGHALFLVNGSARPFGAGLFTVPGSDMRGYVDWFFQTQTWNITHTGFFQSINSGFAVGANTTLATASIPAPWVLYSNSTVVVYNSSAPPLYSPDPTPAWPYGKVRVTAGSAVTGLILQAGVVDGTEVTIVNESAYTITFAASSSTSNVSVSSLALAAGTARKFQFNLPTALWYPLSGS